MTSDHAPLVSDPFASIWNEESLSLQRRLLQRVTSIAASVGIALYLDSGTLLGHVRQGGILPWDDDLDLALPDGSRALELGAAVAKTGLQWRFIGSETFMKVYDPAYPNPAGLPFTWPFIDIFVFHSQGDQLVGSWPTLSLPRALVLPGRRTTFEGADCWEPEQPLAVLDTMYPGWRIRETTGTLIHREGRHVDRLATRHVRTDADGRKIEHAQSVMHVPKMIWSRRSCLVIVRVGDRSRYKTWMRKGAVRTWDLLVNFPDGRESEDDLANMVAVGGPGKYPAAKDLYYAEKSLLRDRRAVLFLDDDIDVAFEDLDRLFMAFVANDLWLAQPSWAQDSRAASKITLNCPFFELHYTNFVEPAAALFSQRALAACIDGFDQPPSSEGLGFVWPKLLGNPTDRIAVIDAVAVRRGLRPQNAEGAIDHGSEVKGTRLYGFVMRSGDHVQKIMLTS